MVTRGWTIPRTRKLRIRCQYIPLHRVANIKWFPLTLSSRETGQSVQPMSSSSGATTLAATFPPCTPPKLSLRIFEGSTLAYRCEKDLGA